MIKKKYNLICILILHSTLSETFHEALTREKNNASKYIKNIDDKTTAEQKQLVQGMIESAYEKLSILEKSNSEITPLEKDILENVFNAKKDINELQKNTLVTFGWFGLNGQIVNEKYLEQKKTIIILCYNYYRDGKKNIENVLKEMQSVERTFLQGIETLEKTFLHGIETFYEKATCFKKNFLRSSFYLSISVIAAYYSYKSIYFLVEKMKKMKKKINKVQKIKQNTIDIIKTAFFISSFFYSKNQFFSLVKEIKK